MIRVTILYKNIDNAFFDLDYYINKHIVLIKQLLSDSGIASVEIQKCTRTLEGGNPNYLYISHFDIEDEVAMNRALKINGETLMSDVPNYTNITPENLICNMVGGGI